MRERLETWLKIACVLLAALLLLQLGRAFVQGNPLARARVPSPPELPPNSNNVANSKGSNAPRAQLGKESNSAAQTVLKTGTNIASAAETNANLVLGTQSANFVSGPHATNLVSSPGLSNIAISPIPVLDSTNQATNTVAGQVNKIGTNAVSTAADMQDTNKVAVGGVSKSGTNLAQAAVANTKSGPAMPPELAAMMGMSPPGAKLAELPAATRAIIDRITDSEILAPVIRPQPMALLGIAGNVAFLRAPSGQTGMIKENDTLGEIKLLRIGINRVLVEQDGKKKELMIFSGYGGESLLTEPDTRK